MAGWSVEFLSKAPKVKQGVLVEGLPGFGNVGKLTVDFIIDSLKAKPIARFTSHAMPHSVFVNEKNLIELPAIELYHKSRAGRDLLLLAGDVQPISEESCYAFSHKVLDVLEQLNCKELITLGGIALRKVPKKPRIYCTGTQRKIVQGYLRETGVNAELYGIVGPIVGVSGVLLGLAAQRHMQGVSLLAETYAHPLYLGVSGAREILKVLNKKFSLRLSIKALDKQIQELEKEMSGKSSGGHIQHSRLSRLRRSMKEEMSYIG